MRRGLVAVLVGVGLLAVLAFLVFARRARLYARIRMSRRMQSRLVFGVLGISFLYTIRMFTVYTSFFGDDLLPLQRVYASTQVAVKNMVAYHNLSSKLSTDIQLTENKSKIR